MSTSAEFDQRGLVQSANALVVEGVDAAVLAEFGEEEFAAADVAGGGYDGVSGGEGGEAGEGAGVALGCGGLGHGGGVWQVCRRRCVGRRQRCTIVACPSPFNQLFQTQQECVSQTVSCLWKLQCVIIVIARLLLHSKSSSIKRPSLPVLQMMMLALST